LIKQQRSKREVPSGYERTDERFKTGRIVTESITCGTETERNTNERHRRVNRHSEKERETLTERAGSKRPESRIVDRENGVGKSHIRGKLD